jgi:hypothetical protein
MKPATLIALALFALPSAHAEGVQKFTRSSLVYFVNGPGDFGDPFMKDRCNEGDQARARQSAEEAARADCEMAQGTRDCLVKFSRITVNGPLGAELLAKYGLSIGGNGYGYWGCEAEALVYGLE